MLRVRRAAKTGNFTQLDNATVVRARALSFQARGVLAFLLSLPDEVASMNAETIAAQSPDGKAKVLSALKELRAAGYLVTERVRLSSGQSVTCQTVYEIPVGAAPEQPGADSQQPVPREPAGQQPGREQVAGQRPVRRGPAAEPPGSQPPDGQDPGARLPAGQRPAGQVAGRRGPARRQPYKDRSSNTEANTPPAPPAAGAPPPARRGEAAAGGTHPVAAFVDALPVPLRPRGTGEAGELTEALYRFLAVGADPVALAAAVAAPPLPEQVFRPAAFVRARLDALDADAWAPAPAPPPWCGACEAPDRRWLERPGGTAEPCPDCSPQAAARRGRSAG